MKAYRPGDKITSLDELMKQELVYFNHKITNKGWFQNWQIGWANHYMQRGFVRKTIKIEQEEKS